MFKKKRHKAISDEKLMECLGHDYGESFNEIYRRYSNRMLYYFYRMLGRDMELAQDFLQEVFLKVIDRKDTFDAQKKFSTWIYSIAHNMCKNEYRSRQTRSILVREEQVDIIDESNALENNFPVTIEDVYNELENLDESHRTAFILKYREGFSLEEIAAIMDLPIGTVKSRLFYARKKLQDKLTVKQNVN